MNSVLVSVIVPTFRRFEPLVRTLEDLLAQDHPRFEIVVADQNASWPPELAGRLDALRHDPRVRWITLEQPGVVVARNRAVAESSGEILLFVDDDVLIPHHGLITNHARHYEADDVSAIVGRECQVGEPTPETGEAKPTARGWLPPPVGLSPLQQTLRFNRNGTEGQWVCTFSTCNGSVRRSAFLAVGGFDESFGGNSYGDDYDLALRLNRAGFAIRYDPASWLIHCRAPLGGLRLSDTANKVKGMSTAKGLWLFVLRHGHRGMYAHLILHHVLRKTVLLKQNLLRPWREPLVVLQTGGAFFAALAQAGRAPRSAFAHATADHAESSSTSGGERA